jgi:hypothetical protein
LGKDCLYYFHKYGLSQVLDCQIMDKFVVSKWEGNIDVNSSFLDYSTGF